MRLADEPISRIKLDSSSILEDFAIPLMHIARNSPRFYEKGHRKFRRLPRLLHWYRHLKEIPSLDMCRIQVQVQVQVQTRWAPSSMTLWYLHWYYKQNLESNRWCKCFNGPRSSWDTGQYLTSIYSCSKSFHRGGIFKYYSAWGRSFSCACN